MHNYKVVGEKPVDIIIEMGLGSCISEWIPMTELLKENHGVLLYERAGINKSDASIDERTPHNIAIELFQLLKKINHSEKVIIIAHSQGGLYAQQFCRLYSYMVKGLILIDPLSARDNTFKESLSKKEYKKSGVDKSGNFKIMKILSKLRLGFISKMILKNAPPLYYCSYYSQEQINEILSCADNVLHASTALEEYTRAHDPKNLNELVIKNGFPDIPLILITHSSELAIEENIKFGGNSREFAMKIESIWQEIMKDYLGYSKKSQWIQATKSTHYIHLQEPKLIVDALEKI